MIVNNYKKDENVKRELSLQTFIRLIKYFKPFKMKIIQILILIGVVIFADLINPLILKKGFDDYIVNKNIKGVVFLGIMLLVINYIALQCSRKKIKAMCKVSNKIIYVIRQQIFKHIQKLSINFFESRSVGKIMGRIVEDVNNLQSLFVNSVTLLIPDVIKIILIVTVMICLNHRLALVTLIILPIIAGFMTFMQLYAREKWRLFQKKGSNLNAFIHENFSGIRIIKAFAAEEKTSSNFLNTLNAYREAFVKTIRIVDLQWPVTTLSQGLGTALVFWYGVNLLDSGTITVGLLIAFINYLSILWSPIITIGNYYNEVMLNLSCAERVFEILDIEPKIIDDPDACICSHIEGCVEFENVSFGYIEGVNILNRISFKTNPGEVIALVGPSGEGKTTIVSMISRFYDVNDGNVLIDGCNIKKMKLDSLRSQIGIMTQDVFLFSGTIMENIRYGRPDASDLDVVAASKSINAHEFIVKLKNGYETIISERGAGISSGQRQLIAFARIILANPKILILDEATASIDTHTEKLIQSGILNLIKGRTTFIIAHRLSTIQNADRILVIKEGRIFEEGSHYDLIEKQGVYSNMINTQNMLHLEKEAG